MGTWGLIQIVIDIFLGLGLFVMAMRMSRAPKDDPRLSRGLQLLQSKISVLEDLSDRTEAQVSQLTAIMDQKIKEVQTKITLAERHVHLVRSAMEKSLEVAKIFQDKIPHEEIIERQNTKKYVQAARLAHQGKSIEEIAAVVDLPKGEIEFIAKVNRDQLMFSEEHLPEWAKTGGDLAALGDSPGAVAVTGAQPSSPGLFAFDDGTDGAHAFTASGMTESDFADPFAGATPIALHGGLSTAGDAYAGVARPTAPHADPRQAIPLPTQVMPDLIENLEAVQDEMNGAGGADGFRRDYSAAFEVPAAQSPSLERLGEEFRKACQSFAPAETSPEIEELDMDAAPMSQPKIVMPAPVASVNALAAKAFNAAERAAMAALGIEPTASVGTRPAPAQPGVAGQAPTRATAPSSPARQNPTAEANPGVNAKADRAPRVINGRTGQDVSSAVIKKVQFPTIKSSDNLG